MSAANNVRQKARELWGGCWIQEIVSRSAAWLSRLHTKLSAEAASAAHTVIPVQVLMGDPRVFVGERTCQMAEIIEGLESSQGLAAFEADRQRLLAANQITAADNDVLLSVSAKVEATKDVARSLEAELMDLDDDEGLTDELRNRTLKVGTAFYRQKAHIDGLRQHSAVSVLNPDTVWFLLAAARNFPGAPSP
ncbi:hypothetical protein HD806DRAFT_523916 [Xylariaceae sp. AK1471]|nr:hypothetical protein HD806DRAFT_523916 [Xylariaceae sp. AK1471]